MNWQDYSGIGCTAGFDTVETQLVLSSHCSIDAQGSEELRRIVDFVDICRFDGGFKTCSGSPRLAGFRNLECADGSCERIENLGPFDD